MNTWFTSDLHFDHFGLINKGGRPFESIEHWNEHILDAINKCAARADRLFILGDFCWKRPGYWRQRIKCRHVELILGNHDKASQCRKVFGGAMYHQRMTKMLGTRVFLSHFPNAFWDLSHRGSLHCYGHCHNQREATLDAIWPDRRSMDVSPDSAVVLTGEWRPFSGQEVYDRLMARKGHDLKEFYHAFQKNLAESRS